MPKILLFANNSSDMDYLISVLESDTAMQFDMVFNKNDAINLLKHIVYDIVFTEFISTDSVGSNIIDYVSCNCQHTKCIVFTKQPSIKNSVEAIRKGASDYLTISSSPEDIFSVIEKSIQKKSDKKNQEKKVFCDIKKFGEIVGESNKIVDIYRTIEKVSTSNSTVLILGESGTGKELIARAIHFNSKRREKALITINCGAIPEELLESELFGHEKGAFTGAHRTRIGRFEIADGGCIFLDEIGDMSPNLQVKILRVLQEQTFERVGSVESIKVNVRIMAATNINLQEAIKKGKFREDLYYRLNVIPINVPSLRERKSDIPLLVDYFCQKLQIENGEKFFSEKSLETLIKYHWPGNVRELENLVEMLFVMTEGNNIRFEDLPDKIKQASQVNQKKDFSFLNSDLCFSDAVEQYEKQLILQALEQTNWIKAKAAKRLKMNRTTLVERIKKMKLKAAKVSENK